MIRLPAAPWPAGPAAWRARGRRADPSRLHAQGKHRRAAARLGATACPPPGGTPLRHRHAAASLLRRQPLPPAHPAHTPAPWCRQRVREILVCYCILLDSQKPLTGALGQRSRAASGPACRPCCVLWRTACRVADAPLRCVARRAPSSLPPVVAPVSPHHPYWCSSCSKRAGRGVRALPGHPVWLQDRFLLRGGEPLSFVAMH